MCSPALDMRQVADGYVVPVQNRSPWQLWNRARLRKDQVRMTRRSHHMHDPDCHAAHFDVKDPRFLTVVLTGPWLPEGACAPDPEQR